VETFTIREAPGGKEPGSGGKSGRSVRLKDGTRAELRSGQDGPVLEFRSRGRALSITGGITEDEMVRVADSFAVEPP
jgi:hypothetical protein